MRKSLLVAGICLFIAQTAPAQSHKSIGVGRPVRPQNPPNVVGFGGYGGFNGVGYYPVYAYDGWGYSGVSSVGGYGSAGADESRASAEAALTSERARTQYIENQREANRLAVDRRNWNEAQRVGQRAEDAERRLAAKQFAASLEAKGPRRSHRLTAQDWNTATGELAWPQIFSSPQFADLKKAVDVKLTDVASRGGEFTGADRGELQGLAAQLQKALGREIHSISSNEFFLALHFIEGIKDAAKYS